MAAKKGKIPAHVTKKEFFHPDTQHPIIYDDKSNEITAMPELMESLDLKNTIITADALNTQKKTVNEGY